MFGYGKYGFELANKDKRFYSGLSKTEVGELFDSYFALNFAIEERVADKRNRKELFSVRNEIAETIESEKAKAVFLKVTEEMKKAEAVL